MMRCLGIFAVGLMSTFSFGQNSIDTLEANAFFNHGVAYSQKGYNTRQVVYYDSARMELNLAANSYKSQDQWDRFFECAHQIGYLYNHQYRYSESKSFLDSIQSNFGNRVKTEYKSTILYYGTFAWTNLQLSNFIESDTWFQKIISILNDNPHATPANFMWTHYYYSVLYFRIGQNDLALKYLDITEDLGIKYDDNSYLAGIYNIRGIISRRIGEFERALEYYTMGYNLQKNQQTKVQLTPFLNNFSWLYHHLGNDSLALFYADDGLQALVDYSDDYYSVESSLRNTKAEILIDLGRYNDAYLLLSKNLEREYGKYGEYGLHSIETKLNLGHLMNEKENYKLSEDYYSEALVLIRQAYGEQSPKLGDVFRQIGNNFADQKNYEKALNWYQQGMIVLVSTFEEKDFSQNPSTQDDILDKLTLLKLLQDKSTALLSRYKEIGEINDLDVAINTNQTGIDLLNNVRQNLYYGESKQVLTGLMKPIFEQSIQLAIEGLSNNPGDENYLEMVFNAMEGSKSYILSSALQESGKEGSSLLSDSIQKEQELIFLQTEYLSKKQNDLKAKSGPDSIAIEEVKQELFLAREAYQDFKKELGKKYPDYSRTRFGDSKNSLETVRKRLKNKELIIEYFSGEKNLYAIAITRSEAKLFEFGSYKEIEQKVREFAYFSIDMNPNDYQRKAFEIYMQILEPVLDQIEQRNIIVIPDGVLGYIPFDALVTAKIENPSFLDLKYGIKEYSVTQHYLASLFVSSKKNRDISGPFIGYAPDFLGEQTTLLATRSGRDSTFSNLLVRLPFARSEVEAVATLFDGEAVIGEMASESHFKSEAMSYKFLHVASHSIVDNERPLFSKLVFAKDENDTIEDGLLHAYELYSMQINSELVTLSACNTGIGQFKNGEGIISLARGFIYAGASSVLMSLWEVADESTSTIMQSFYKEIDRGVEKSKAIQNAKLEYLSNADNITSNPYYWAGFTYLGNQERSDTNWYPYLVIFIVLIAAAARQRRRQIKKRNQPV